MSKFEKSDFVADYLTQELERLEQRNVKHDEAYFLFNTQKKDPRFPNIVLETTKNLLKQGFDQESIATQILSNPKLYNTRETLKNNDYSKTELAHIEKLFALDQKLSTNKIQNEKEKISQQMNALIDSPEFQNPKKASPDKIYENIIINSIKKELTLYKKVDHQVREEITEKFSPHFPNAKDPKFKKAMNKYLTELAVYHSGNASFSKSIKHVFSSSKVNKYEKIIRGAINEEKEGYAKTLGYSIRNNLKQSNESSNAIPSNVQVTGVAIKRSKGQSR